MSPKRSSRGYVLLPVAVLLILLNQLFPYHRWSGAKFWDFIGSVGKLFAELAALLAGIGLIVGALVVTGKIGNLASDLLALAGGSTIILLLMGAFTSFVLGIGMTVTAAYVFLAIALAPAVGPVLGGYMHVWFGWRSNFALLTGLVAIVSLLIWRFLPETLDAADHGALRPARLLGGYLGLLRDGPFMAYALAAAMGMAALFAIVAAFPFVLIEGMGVATEHYGYYYAAIVVSFFLGSLVVTQITERVSNPLGTTCS